MQCIKKSLSNNKTNQWLFAENVPYNHGVICERDYSEDIGFGADVGPEPHLFEPQYTEEEQLKSESKDLGSKAKYQA